MPALDAYLEAVAKRKAIDRRGPSPCVNYAIAVQLEETDIPLLTEIIRVQHQALVAIENEPLGDEGGLHSAAKIALNRVDELAAQGSTARWGDHRKENGGG